MESWKSDTEALISTLQSSTSIEQIDEGKKMLLLKQLETLTSKLEPPFALLADLAQAPNKLVVARIAIAMGIFDAFAANQFGPVSTTDLDAKTKGEKTLLVRILRMLCAYKMVEQINASTWKATQFGHMLVTGSPAAMVVINNYSHLKSHSTLLEYLEKLDFKNPQDYLLAPWGYAWGTQKGYYDWLSTGDSLRQEAFSASMAISSAFRGEDWFDFYPVTERLTMAGDRPLLVDVGAGLGHEVRSLKEKHPNLPGKMFVQDFPQVVQDIKEPFPAGVEVQAHDAFTPQPVKNAKAYYMRNVLHAWPEPQALQILKHLHDAMAPDSILLVNDNVMPEEGFSRTGTELDFTMMNVMSGMERTEAQWRSLLESAGFQVVKVWKPSKVALIPFLMFEATLK